jgi:hypothetical protein
MNSRGGVGLSDADIQYAEQGFALGAVGYIAGIGLLLPCVLMASFAAYRLRRFEATGIAPYTSGCSPVSLAVAQMLGWPALAVITILAAFATGLCSDVAAQLNKYNSNNFVEYLFLPGPLAAGASITLQLLGLILLAVISRSLSSVHGVGCNRGGCCFKPASDDDPAAPSQDGAPLIYTGRAPAAPSSYNKQPMNAAVPMLSVGSA